MKRLDLAHVAYDAVDLLRGQLAARVDLRFRAGFHSLPLAADPASLRRVIAALVTAAVPEAPPRVRLRLEAAPHAEPADLSLALRQLLPVESGRAPFTADQADLQSIGAVLEPHEGLAPGLLWQLRFAAAEPPRALGEALPIGDETILLVDDEEIVRETGRRALERLGYRVVLAADGLEALERIATVGDAVDLLLTDITMPRLSGLELVRHLRNGGSRVRVLVASGSAPLTERGPGAPPPGLPFIGKPWLLAELAAAVRRALDEPPA